MGPPGPDDRYSPGRYSPRGRSRSRSPVRCGRRHLRRSWQPPARASCGPSLRQPAGTSRSYAPTAACTQLILALGLAAELQPAGVYLRRRLRSHHHCNTGVHPALLRPPWQETRAGRAARGAVQGPRPLPLPVRLGRQPTAACPSARAQPRCRAAGRLHPRRAEFCAHAKQGPACPTRLTTMSLAPVCRSRSRSPSRSRSRSARRASASPSPSRSRSRSRSGTRSPSEQRFSQSPGPGSARGADAAGAPANEHAHAHPPAPVVPPPVQSVPLGAAGNADLSPPGSGSAPPAVAPAAAPAAPRPGAGASGAKPPPSAEAIKKELLRLRRQETELGNRVRALQGDAQPEPGPAGRSAV